MENIGAILGSSAFGVIITLVFNWAQNRKNHSLSYITDERRAWRQNIRLVASGIEKSEYKKQGKHNIEPYLVQLQMSINPYGRTDKYDYLHDGHIWEVISKLRESENKKQFEKNKELLLAYLSLMLKEDWERSKREVRGYSNVVKYIFLYIAIFIGTAIYYFYILNIKNAFMYMIFLFANFVPLLLIKIYFINEIKELSYIKRILPIKEVVSNEKAVERKITGMVVCIVIYLGIIGGLLFFGLPELMVKNIEYYTDLNDTVYVYLDVNDVIFDEFESKLEEEIGKSVVRLEKNETFPSEIELPYNYDKEIERVINSYLIFINYIILIVLFVAVLYVFCSILGDDCKGKKIENEIKEIKHLVFDEYSEIVENILLIIDKIEVERELDSSVVEELLGLEYRLLNDLKNMLKIQKRAIDESIQSIKEFEYRKIVYAYEKHVDESIALIKKFSKDEIKGSRTAKVIELKYQLYKLQPMEKMPLRV